MTTTVIIPFRDRGIDPRRGANLEVVMAWWYAHGFDPRVVDDGLSGDAQFNRHRAYNRAVERFPETQTFVFTEADMLIHPKQIIEAVTRALRHPGLVVPFTQYRYLSDESTGRVRDWYNDQSPEQIAYDWSLQVADPASLFNIKPESTMEDGRSIGAVNVVSRRTLDLTGGFTESTRGNWYDDNIIEEAFAFLTGYNTRWVDGPAVHMYHLPGHKGDHLTAEDKAATENNRRVLYNVRRAIRYQDRTTVKQIMEARA
jgi:hypothetical protein